VGFNQPKWCLKKDIDKIGFSPTNMVAYGGVYGIFYGMNWYGDLKLLNLPGPLWVEALYSLTTPTQCFFSSRACSVDTFCLDLLEKPPKLINTHIPHRFAESMFMTDQEKESLRKHSETNLGLYIIWLVVSTPLKKYESHLGLLFPILVESRKIP